MSMLCIPGQPGKDLCDSHLGVTRRDILRVGGSAVLGMTLGNLLGLKQAQANTGGGPGWGKAKSVIMVYLQGGPSHLDLWDPKENVPDNVRSVFKRINSKVPGMETTELLPKLVALQVFRALLENAVGEHSARMTAMDNATKNTKELIGSLTLTMNRARQAAITRELIEIVSGAEALNG